MDYIKDIMDYVPTNSQEREDQRVILDYIRLFPQNILLRNNEFAHITSSGFIMNEALDKVLMVHHNIRNAWAWTGGHADGDADLLHVAIKEAQEETGVSEIKPFQARIASLDILPVLGHTRRGRYVCTHLHLSIAYILIANEEEQLIVKEDENSGVRWMPVDRFNHDSFDNHDVYLYNKLIQRAKQMR